MAFEDVGRHNALDKLIGSLVLSRADATDGFVFLSSRASYGSCARPHGSAFRWWRRSPRRHRSRSRSRKRPACGSSASAAKPATSTTARPDRDPGARRRSAAGAPCSVDRSVELTEIRLALLEERRHRLARFRRAQHRGEVARFLGHPRLCRHPARILQQRLRHTQRCRRQRRELCRLLRRERVVSAAGSTRLTMPIRCASSASNASPSSSSAAT